MSKSLTEKAQTVSLFKKRRYLLGMSEDDFRDLVVRPLLLRTGLQDGRDLCGAFERGKDCLFVAETALGTTDVYVVQTKKGAINLARKASQNLLDAVTQLRMALDTKVVLLKEKQKCLPAKAYLVASGSINDAARSHIVEELHDPRVQFLDADDLIQLIDSRYPELWFGIDANLQPYLRALKKSVEDISEDAVESQHNSASSATDGMYVPLYAN